MLRFADAHAAARTEADTAFFVAGWTVGSRLAVAGGYDVDPEWLSRGAAVSGSLAAWLELPGKEPHLPCV